jgi:imidazolonepropionase-like amidohydrolase
MNIPRFILAGSLIDGDINTARKDIVLIVVDGLITAITTSAEVNLHAGSMVDDLSHCTIVPPLVDCSVVLSRSPAVDPKMQTPLNTSENETQTTLVERHIGYCHDHGVLGVVDSETPTELIKNLQDRTGQKKMIVIHSANEHGGNFVRVNYSPDLAADGESNQPMNSDELDRRLQQNQGKKKVVVANGPRAVAEALAAGCDAIEQGYLMGAENLTKMAANRILWIPSLVRAKNGMDSSGSGGDVCCRFSLRYVAPGKPLPGAEAYWKQLLADQLEQLRLARELGVPTTVGTGCGNMGIIHGESVVEEIKLFIKAGYCLEEAIRCASVQGARFFGMEQIGALTVGRPATFLVTRGTPQQLPRKLAYLENIYVNGSPSRDYRKNPVKVFHKKGTDEHCPA